MIARLLITICSVAASVGFVLYGMATTYVERDQGMADLGIALMVGGVIGTIIGVVIYRAQERNATLDTRQ
jgi:hypothetical protein